MNYARLRFSTLVGLLSLFSLVYADNKGVTPLELKNHTGLFIGLGGSYNWAKVNANTSGTLNAISGIPSLGIMSGTTGSYSNSAQALAPLGKIGYIQNFTNSNWLWGIDFLYQYSEIKIRSYGNDMDPGTSITLLNSTANTTDKITMATMQIKVSDTFLLPVFLGHSFKNYFVYLGVGPYLFKTQYNVYDSTDMLSAHYIGKVDKFADTKWMWGGLAQTGFAYYLSQTWFLDINYTYAITGEYSTEFSSTFAPAVNGGLNSGTLNFSNNQRLVNQEIALSINKIL